MDRRAHNTAVLIEGWHCDMLQHSLSQSICARFSNNLYQTWGIVHLGLTPCKLVNMYMYMQADQPQYTVCIYYMALQPLPWVRSLGNQCLGCAVIIVPSIACHSIQIKLELQSSFSRQIESILYNKSRITGSEGQKYWINCSLYSTSGSLVFVSIQYNLGSMDVDLQNKRKTALHILENYSLQDIP